MYLLYLDDAGSVPNASDRHVVLAGVVLFERQVHFLDRLLEDLAETIAPAQSELLEFAFEQIVRRFDQFLSRLHRANNTQRGLLILDKSTLETRRQQLARTFKREGHSWGKTRNLVDVLFFVDSAATRAVQYADMVAYSLWRSYEKDDHEFLTIIQNAFDEHGGVRHGLFVQRKDADYA